MLQTTGPLDLVQYLSRKLKPLAIGITLLITVLAPLTYWIHAHGNLQNMAALYADDLAAQLQQVALESPTLWKYQTYKFAAITDGFHPMIDVSGFRVLDEKGELVIEQNYSRPRWQKPGENLSFREVLTSTLGSAPIIFNDRRIGTLEVLVDDSTILRTSAIILCLSALFGIALGVLVYHFPVLVTRKMAGKIEELISDLRHSEDKYRSIVEYAYDVIYLLNLDSTFRSLNPVFEQLTGWRPEEWIGKSFISLIHPDDLPFANDIYSKALAGESVSSFGLRLARKSGEYFDADLCIAPLGGDVVTGAVGIVRDVTERKRAEAEIRKLNEELETKVQERTQQLQEAQEELVRKEKMAILGQLSGSVGHELRNPLGVMSNAVYFLKMVHSDADTTTQEYLEIIKQEIDNSLRIITDLLDFARTRPPQRQSVSAAELVQKSLERCAIPENVRLTVALPAEMPHLHVDPQQIEQVLINFISNGVQAMPAGGTLQVAARLVGSDAKFDGDFIEISVTDSGTGIAPENRNKLFQPLFTTKTKGIGLGLVVCKNLVEANGGTIKVESEWGKGATFTVLLPLGDHSEANRRTESEERDE